MNSRCVLVVCAAMWGCTRAPCPKGATLASLPDPMLDGGTEALCRMPDGRLQGAVTLTWDGTRPRLTGRFEENRPVGAWTWWHANGKKRASYGFAEGLPTGAWETWHPNGKTQWQVSFQDGAPHGPAREFREDGSKRFEAAFTSGQRSGAWTAWYRSGAKAGEGAYAADRPAGHWTVWWKSGAVAGTREGRDDWKYAAPDGGALTKSEYRDTLHPPATPSGGLLDGLVVGEAQPIDWGLPEYVAPLTVPPNLDRDLYFPWGALHGVWFDEFRIELGLEREDLE